MTLKNIRDELLQHGVRALSYIEFSNMQRMIASACGLCYCKVGICFASHLVMISGSFRDFRVFGFDFGKSVLLRSAKCI